MAEPEGKRQKLDEMQQQQRVIIVGGGLAGLSAAIEAFNDGVNVVLLDKMKSYNFSILFSFFLFLFFISCSYCIPILNAFKISQDLSIF